MKPMRYGIAIFTPKTSKRGPFAGFSQIHTLDLAGDFDYKKVMDTQRKALLPILLDALTFLSATLGVTAVLANWRFMSPAPRLTEAPFLCSFTGLSNLSVGIVALLCLLFRLIGKKTTLPYPLFIVKCCFAGLILITFLVTACYLSPSTGDQWWRLYINGGLFNHLLTPILATLAFLLGEPKRPTRFHDALYVCIPMGCYAVFYMIRAYTHIPPEGGLDLYYDIYGFARWGIGVTIALLFAFIVLSIGLATMLLAIFNARPPRSESKG